MVGALSPVNHTKNISGLKETFIKRYIVERTNKPEIKPGKQSKKAESCRDEIQLKVP